VFLRHHLSTADVWPMSPGCVPKIPRRRRSHDEADSVSQEGSVTQAHIHIGQPGVNGGIVLFLCTNLAPPAGVPVPPACPNTPGQSIVTGTLSAANVITTTAQGIAAGDFAEVINAMRALVSYANVHSDQFPGGEIRGQITK
jgi:hypothetical protein